MYNGIGLQTARGSGTNGHVQRNWALVRNSKDKVKYRTEQEIVALDAAANKQPNQEILDHERKRKVELKCIEFEEILEEQGYSQAMIAAKVENYRSMLMGHDAKGDVQRDQWGRVAVTETHQMAEAQQEKNAKLRAAFGISEYFVEGSSLDPARQAKEELARSAAAGAAAVGASPSLTPVKRYDLVRTPSPDKERERKKKKRDSSSSVEPKKDKKKKSKKHKKDRTGKKKKAKRKRRASTSSSDSDNSDSSSSDESSSSGSEDEKRKRRRTKEKRHEKKAALKKKRHASVSSRDSSVEISNKKSRTDSKQSKGGSQKEGKESKRSDKKENGHNIKNGRTADVEGKGNNLRDRSQHKQQRSVEREASSRQRLASVERDSSRYRHSSNDREAPRQRPSNYGSSSRRSRSARRSRDRDYKHYTSDTRRSRNYDRTSPKHRRSPDYRKNARSGSPSKTSRSDEKHKQRSRADTTPQKTALSKRNDDSGSKSKSSKRDSSPTSRHDVHSKKRRYSPSPKRRSITPTRKSKEKHPLVNNKASPEPFTRNASGDREAATKHKSKPADTRTSRSTSPRPRKHSLTPERKRDVSQPKSARSPKAESSHTPAKKRSETPQRRSRKSRSRSVPKTDVTELTRQSLPVVKLKSPLHKDGGSSKKKSRRSESSDRGSKSKHRAEKKKSRSRSKSKQKHSRTVQQAPVVRLTLSSDEADSDAGPDFKVDEEREKELRTLNMLKCDLAAKAKESIEKKIPKRTIESYVAQVSTHFSRDSSPEEKAPSPPPAPKKNTEDILKTLSKIENELSKRATAAAAIKDEITPPRSRIQISIDKEKVLTPIKKPEEVAVKYVPNIVSVTTVVSEGGEVAVHPAVINAADLIIAGKSPAENRSQRGSRSPAKDKQVDGEKVTAAVVEKETAGRKSRSSSRSTESSPRHGRYSSSSSSRSRSRSRSCSREHSRSRSGSRSRSRSPSSSSEDDSDTSRSKSAGERSRSSRSRSPSIPRRHGSPSFLDRRRITSKKSRSRS